jgi:hypothetical protein
LQQTGNSGVPRHDVLDLESDADPEKQGQRDDVGGVEREVAQRADLEGYGPGDRVGCQGQQHLDNTAQRDQERPPKTRSRPDGKQVRQQKPPRQPETRRRYQSPSRTSGPADAFKFFQLIAVMHWPGTFDRRPA